MGKTLFLAEILKPDFEFADDRGRLVQVARSGWRQINLISSLESSQRGGHYHRLNTEAFYVIAGSFDLRLRLGEQEEECRFRAGDMFLIRPLVTHYFSFLEDTLLIGLYDLGVELADGSRDIYKAEDE